MAPPQPPPVAPRPIIQVIQMPPAPRSHHSTSHHTHRFPHPSSHKSAIPASIGPPVVMRTQKTASPPHHGSHAPHTHTFTHQPGKVDQITILPDETMLVKETIASPRSVRGGSKGLPKVSNKGMPSPPPLTQISNQSVIGEPTLVTTATAAVMNPPSLHEPTGNTTVNVNQGSPPQNGVTRIEIRPVLQHSKPVHTERVMMRGPDGTVPQGTDRFPAGKRFSDIRPIPISESRRISWDIHMLE